ncbi:Translin [Nadsonia fulvescens var. elongata DSM 6958]|uniref:Translin n=1 Tax=Nadsonia fulvescens var. elongata DSM 6958 TaxID=857566 RepID=A0A1E3PJU2_9ASCO|nr:Translin [Nadsonia fulvescens var. elongata DSM 6958]
MPNPILDGSVFEALQREIDVNALTVELIKTEVAKLDDVLRNCTALLSRVHSTAPSQLSRIIAEYYDSGYAQKLTDALSGLNNIIEGKPVYKYKPIWTSSLQQVIYVILYVHFLSRVSDKTCTASEFAELLATPKDVSLTLKVKCTMTNQAIQYTGSHTDDQESKVVYDLNDLDGLWFGTEEYLHAIISLINELSRLSVNLVTTISTTNALNKDQSDTVKENFTLPVMINTFIKSLQSGFMMLNLKNDSLRRRFDSIKYDVKKTEDVVYDLAVRGLL